MYSAFLVQEELAGVMREVAEVEDVQDHLQAHIDDSLHSKANKLDAARSVLSCLLLLILSVVLHFKIEAHICQYDRNPLGVQHGHKNGLCL